jgi:predicted nucleotidyltransferase
MLSRSVAAINTVLMLHPDVPLPMAAIARAAGLAYAPAASALQTLEKRGLVLRSSRGGTEEFAPDPQSPHYPIAYASALVDLPLADAIAGESVYAIYAYGSMAQPGAGKGSDLDLLIVADVKDRDQFTDQISLLGERLGRTIDPFIVTPEELEAAQASGDSHIAAALAGVRLMGTI